jgi:hypothetical protein
VAPILGLADELVFVLFSYLGQKVAKVNIITTQKTYTGPNKQI